MSVRETSEAAPATEPAVTEEKEEKVSHRW